MAKVFSFGESDISEINDMNVPMNIFITEHSFRSFTEEFPYFPFDDYFEADESNENIKNDDIVYVLTAGNYTPRRETMSCSAYMFMSTNKQELVNIVQKQIVPLYEAALTNLKNNSTNYFWEVKQEG